MNTDILKSQCSSNKWQYSIAKKGSAPFKTSSATSLSTKLINETVDEGNIFYVIEIWGVNDAGIKITPTPNVSAEVKIDWPGSNFSIVGNVDISYLEHEGPKSTFVTPTDAEGWVLSATLIPAVSASNTNKWKYSLNNTDWFELSELTTKNLNINSPLYFRLKVDQLGGNDHNDNSTAEKLYNSSVVVEYEENNGNTKTKTITLNGKVLNRIIGLTSWVDDNDTDFNATVTISKSNLTRWQYKVEKLEDATTSFSSPKIVVPYGAIESGTSKTINLQSYIENSGNDAQLGPGHYKVYIRGVHNTEDTTVVTVELSEIVFVTWPDPIYTLSGSMSNSFREYEGTEYTDTFEIVNHQYFDDWSFVVGNGSWITDFYYKIGSEAEVLGLPGNTSSMFFVGDNPIQFRLNPVRRANDDTTTYGNTTDKLHWTSLGVYIYGKNVEKKTLADNTTPWHSAPNVVLHGNIRLETTILERYITETIALTETPNSLANTIQLSFDFLTTEISRYSINWYKNDQNIKSVPVSNNVESNGEVLYDIPGNTLHIIDLNDVASDYLGTGSNTFKVEVIGHSTTDTGDTHESGWIPNQVAPALIKTIQVAWPSTIFTVSETISDTYVWQGVTATPATNGTLVSITKGWVKTITLNNATGTDVGNWQYSLNNGTNWNNLTGVNIEVSDHTQLKFRLKANLEVDTYNDVTVDLIAHDVQSVNTTETINLQGSVTKPTPTFSVSPTSISGEYRETEGPSAEKTISISTKFLKSVKWKSSDTISWEYLDGSTWKDLPTNYVTILNKPYQLGQTYSTQEVLTIKVRLKADLEVPGADDMDAQIESHNFNNIITFEAISSHDDDVTAGKQVALNGTITEYPNGCADYDLSFDTTGSKVVYEDAGVTINKFQDGGHICVNSFGNSFGSRVVSLEVRDSMNQVVTSGSVSTNWDWANGNNVVYKAPDQKAYEAKNFAFGQGNVILTPMNL